MRLAEAVMRTDITEVVTDAGGDINDLATFNVHVVAVGINAETGGETNSYLQGYVKTGPCYEIGVHLTCVGRGQKGCSTYGGGGMDFLEQNTYEPVAV